MVSAVIKEVSKFLGVLLNKTLKYCWGELELTFQKNCAGYATLLLTYVYVWHL